MSDALWNLQEILAATGGRAHNAAADLSVSGVSIDSRTLRPGDLFFAIRGVAKDGHGFVPAAFEAGAAACVVAAEKLDSLPSGRPYVVVEDTLAAMQGLARAARARMAGRVVAVTGSVGKTSTKEMLRAALSPSGATHAPERSYNNHWGVPLTAARMPPQSAYAVFEIGMSGPNEISPLSKLVRPHVAIVTSVAPVHLEFFDSVEGIADAKSEIFDGPEPEGAAILNHDNAWYERVLEHALQKTRRVYSFGTHKAADARLVDMQADEHGSQVEAEILGRRLSYRLALPGAHQVANSLAVLLAVELAGADLAAAARALAQLSAAEGRGTRERLKSAEGAVITLIDESYNANPASVRAALAVLEAMRPEDGGRRIAVLGDMLELGAESQRLHGELAGVLVERHVDLVFACGRHMKVLYDTLPETMQGAYAPDSAALAGEVPGRLRHGDVVMVKGSNGVKMRRVLERLRASFSEPV